MLSDGAAAGLPRWQRPLAAARIRVAASRARALRHRRGMRPWTVLPHDPVEKLDDNLWTVEGDLPHVRARRRMFIVRRSDGGLMFAGAAIPLEPRALAEVTTWGRPAMLAVPHHWHMIDAAAFGAKLGVPIYAPAEGEAAARRRAPIAGTLAAVPADPHVTVETVAGVRTGEVALVVTSGGGARRSLLFADVVQNNPRDSLSPPFRWLGLGGGPKVHPLFRLLFLRDRKALRAQLERWAELPGLARLVPCHGRIVTGGAADALRAVAATL